MECISEVHMCDIVVEDSLLRNCFGDIAKWLFVASYSLTGSNTTDNVTKEASQQLFFAGLIIHTSCSNDLSSCALINHKLTQFVSEVVHTVSNWCRVIFWLCRLC